jgi:hypothetical protein
MASLLGGGQLVAVAFLQYGSVVVLDDGAKAACVGKFQPIAFDIAEMRRVEAVIIPSQDFILIFDGIFHHDLIACKAPVADYGARTDAAAKRRIGRIGLAVLQDVHIVVDALLAEIDGLLILLDGLNSHRELRPIARQSDLAGIGGLAIVVDDADGAVNDAGILPILLGCHRAVCGRHHRDGEEKLVAHDWPPQRTPANPQAAFFTPLRCSM